MLTSRCSTSLAALAAEVIDYHEAALQEAGLQGSHGDGGRRTLAPAGLQLGLEPDDLLTRLPALQLNLLSTVAMCQAVVPHLVDQGWGRIIAITSHSVRQPVANLILSNTARAGFTAFLKTVATEVAADGVTVNSLQPGLHNTARLAGLYGGDVSGAAAAVPAQTLGDPADFGRIAAFLCSESAKYITGVSLPVDGGAVKGLQ